MSVLLENKKYFFMVEPTKSCQLSCHARWVYSFLVFRTSYNKAASQDCICRNIGVCNRAIPAQKPESAKRQINRIAKSLRERGLLDDQWNVTVQEKDFVYWRDADELVNPRSRSDEGYKDSREYVLDCLQPYECRFYRDKLQMGKDLDQHDQAMRKAGYNSKQISDYWYEIMMDPQFCDRQYRLIEMFVRKGFPVAFMVAEEITVVNRATGKYSGISLGMLRKKSQQTLLDMKYWDEKRSARDSKGQTSSMLMYYDSSHEGLRSGSKSAG